VGWYAPKRLSQGTGYGTARKGLGHGQRPASGRQD